MDYRIRKMNEEEYPLLKDFLYEAIFIPKEVSAPDRSIIYEPLLWRMIEDFGKLEDDYCLVAEVENRVVGAVWVRIAEQFGHIDNSTPSLSISLYPEYRNKGIGTGLMTAMLDYLKDKGYARASLSVQKENYAVKMYRAVGFEILQDNGEEFVMIHNLSHPDFSDRDSL